MKRVSAVVTLALGAALCMAAHAGSWQFSPPIPVTASEGETLFHHLESSGRRSIAVSDTEVAVTWEDDRDGTPRVYLARKRFDEENFREALLTPDAEAYEPTVAALPDGRFLVAWEQDAQIWARVNDSAAAQLSEHEGAQASLLAAPDGAVLVFAERAGRYPRIVMRHLVADAAGTLTATPACAIDPVEPIDEQLYPGAAWSGDRLVVAWEDRRPKHTIIMAAAATGDCTFTPPQRISLRPKGNGARDLPFGTGHGVARVALHAYGDDRVFAAWDDKRNFRHGYDVWGADIDPVTGQFGENVQVQDDFGELAAQWHISVAGAPDGTLVVSWDDGREGNADIMLSWREDGEWSDDTPLPGASGEGEQAHASIVLDAEGRLHAAWVERDDPDGPTRLRYTVGTPAP